MLTQRIADYETEFGGFEKLMPHRIKNILMVASLYDSFLLADDERLNEALFSELLDNTVRSAPKITRVSTADQAVERLLLGPFDLVIAMIQIGDTDMDNFVAGLKRTHPGLPIVLLSFNMQDVVNISDLTRSQVNGVFLWNGDTRIFSAIINLLEDEMNFSHDSKVGVQAVLLVEDNIKFYSSYLPIIYSELMKQTQIVMAEELNPSKKMLRLKARPKVLFCNNFDKAWEIYSKYKANLLGVISDIEYPMAGKCEPEAGLLLSKKIKTEDPDMPVLLQSSNSKFALRAQGLGASFMNKAASDLSKQLRNFIVRYFGFGDFVFTDKNGLELARAADLHTMLKLLKTVPIDSILYHAGRNHFSKWLFARTEFETAYNIRPKRISEFKDSEALRKYLIETLYQFIYKTQLGTVLRFDRKLFDNSTPFVKIGSGGIGGKARGLAFVDFLLSRSDLADRFPGVFITVPNTIVLATDVFDFFLEQNNLDAAINEHYSGERIADIFLKARLPDYVRQDLRAIVEKLDGPLAVRSSSLLEDSKTQPFAGIYKTYMLANNNPDPELRLQELEKAVKFVYASTFSNEAKAYRKLTPHLPDEEKMAVVIQKVVGRAYAGGARFYPVFSGVVQSYNYYPVPPLSSEDPIAHIGMGLGKTIVEGLTALRFSPSHPRNLHQFSTIDDFFSNSQKNFIALDVSGAEIKPLTYDKEPDLKPVEIEAAEADGTLELVASSYSAEDDIITDSISRPGERLVTFAPILKNELIPLSEILTSLSRLGREAMGANIEIEFAASFDPESRGVEFNILQMRPMVSRSVVKKVKFEDLISADIVCSSLSTLGNGYINDISDLVFVKPETFTSLKTREIAAEIGELNLKLKNEGRYCMIIGPGRWGSSDPFLGIPVKWNHISHAKVIIEAAYGGFSADPSYGTHFFHNLTSLGIGYLTVNPEKNEGMIDWNWLNSRPVLADLNFVRHIRLEHPLDIRIDGSTGKGIIAHN
ncbi:MAG: PEP/pyruvate-binding domain-containing protein [Elusimicrobiales bacterium]|jgi:CheY-like chemotaxis protein